MVDLLAGLDGFEQRRLYLSAARTPARALPSLARGLFRVRREAAEADLLHVVGDTATLICTPFFRHHAAVWSTQGLHLLRRARGPAGAALRRRMRVAIGRSRRTICSSGAELEELAALAGPSLAQRLVEVPNGIPLGPAPTAGARAAARHRHGLGENEVAVLYLGELEPRKRPLDVVAAVERARQSERPLVLLLAGDGPQAGALAGHADDGVRPLGFEPDPASLLAAADIFAMPSEREGLSLAVIEAMASGLAVVASDGPGNPDAVGDAGLLHRVGDVDGLSQALARLADDPEERRRLGAAARARAEERFSLDRFLAEMAAMFSDALDSPYKERMKRE